MHIHASSVCMCVRVALTTTTCHINYRSLESRSIVTIKRELHQAHKMYGCVRLLANPILVNYFQALTTSSTTITLLLPKSALASIVVRIPYGTAKWQEAQTCALATTRKSTTLPAMLKSTTGILETFPYYKDRDMAKWNRTLLENSPRE